jgi:hypothetical protein
MPEQKGWGLVLDFFREKPLIGALFTAASIFHRPMDFIAEVAKEDWSGKTKPVDYFFQSYLTWVAAICLTPMRSEFNGRYALRSLFLLFGLIAAFGVAHRILGWQKTKPVHSVFVLCYIHGTQFLLAGIVPAAYWVFQPPIVTGWPRLAPFGVMIVMLVGVMLWFVRPLREFYVCSGKRIVFACSSFLLCFATLACLLYPLVNYLEVHCPRLTRLW